MLELKSLFENDVEKDLIKKIKKTNDYSTAISLVTNRKNKAKLKNEENVKTLLSFILRSKQSIVVFSLINESYIKSATHKELKFIMTYLLMNKSDLNCLALNRMLDYIEEKYDLDKKIEKIGLRQDVLYILQGYMYFKKYGIK